MFIKFKNSGSHSNAKRSFIKKTGVFAAVSYIFAKTSRAYALINNSTWDGRTIFTASKGLNEGNPLGFDVYRPWAGHPNRWSDWMTPTRWASITSQTTFDHIRVCIDPTPMLRSTTDSVTTAIYLGMVKGAIDDVLAHGLKVIIDMHVSTSDVEYSDALLCAGYPNGVVWYQMKQVWSSIGMLLNQYDTQKVAFELYNEASAAGLEVRYVPMIKDLVAFLRQQCGHKITYLIMPYNSSFKKSANPMFVASDFGQNTGFVYHMYDPGIFSHQALDGSMYWKYIKNLGFPAVEANRNETIAAAAGLVNADSSLSSSQKIGYINECITNINYFFNNYAQKLDYDGKSTVPAIGPFFQTFGSLNPSTPGAGDNIEMWRVSQGVSASRIFITEFGAHQKYETEGADQVAYVAWLTLINSYLNVHGFSRTIWNDDDRHFSIRKNILNRSPHTPNGNFDRDILAAIGAFKPSDSWTFADEPAGTFIQVIEGDDAATYTTSGGFISKVRDKSGAGNHWIQGTASLQPAEALKNGIRIGITTDEKRFISSTLPANNDTESIFLVITLTSVAGNRTLIGPASAGGKRGFRVNNGQLQMLRSGLVQEATTLGLSVPFGVPCLVECQILFGQQTIMGVNGVLQQRTGSHERSFGTASSSYIGTKDDGGEDGVFTVHACYVLPTRPSVALASQIRFHLKSKWGIA